MTNKKTTLFYAPLIVLFGGCSTFTPPAQMKAVDGSGTYWLNYSSDRRGAIVRNANEKNDGGSVKICAEPAPDTSNNFEFQGGLKRDAIGEVSAQTGQNVIILPGRNSTVLTLRESLYRLCELSINRTDIPGPELMNAYNKVIIAVTRYAEAEVAKAEAVTAEIVKSPKPISPEKSALGAAKDEERTGFENIVKGDFSAALESFNRAEEFYPGYHNVFEIRSSLKKSLTDNKMDDAEKQAFLRNIVTKWSWGVPSDLVSQIKAQIK